jgi:hypothetical protein
MLGAWGKDLQIAVTPDGYPQGDLGGRNSGECCDDEQHEQHLYDVSQEDV